jgi:hypothetical protein
MAKRVDAVLSKRAIIRKLVREPERKGKKRLAAFDVMRRALELRGRAKEERIAACVSAVFVAFGYEPYVTEEFVEKALGLHSRGCDCVECHPEGW